MVRHATQKKRRRGTKVTRKTPKNKALKVRNAISSAVVRKEWNNSVSVKDNFKNLGLVTDANHIADSAASRPEKPTAFEGFAPVSSVKAGFDDVNPRRKILSDFDQQFIKRCIGKHGKNFLKMASDIKVNDRQLTAIQLEKMCAKYEEAIESSKD